MHEQGGQGESLARMVELLSADVDRAFEMLRATGGQYERRALVRCVLVTIEAATYLMKNQCLARENRKPGLYTFEEVAVLREETFALDSRGQIFGQPKYLPTDANFRFALSLFMRPCDPDFRLDAGGEGWRNFKQSLQIRHRITHPKSVKALEISDDEVNLVMRAYAWFLGETSDAMKKSALFHEAIADALRKDIEALARRADKVGSGNQAK